jgi:hypothetical protein
MGSIHGYEIASGLPLRRLSAAPGIRGRIRLECASRSLLDHFGELTAWMEWDGIEDQSFALARTAGGLLACCSATGTFEIDAAAATITVAGRRLDEAWEHRVGTTAVPLLLSERGDLALHASAVTVDGRAFLFCGPSGRGKSTLALLASQLGHPVVSEDGVVVTVNGGGPTAWPGPRGIQVSDGLRMLGSGLEPTGPAPVAAICHLAERGDELSVNRLSPAEALPALAPNLIHAGGPESLRPAFAQLARAVQGTALFRVTMPDRISEAPTAARALLERLADGSPGARRDCPPASVPNRIARIERANLEG